MELKHRNEKHKNGLEKIQSRIATQNDISSSVLSLLHSMWTGRGG